MSTDRVCVRTHNMGVFVGVLTSPRGNEVTLNDCTRIWYWAGAFTLSQLATEGVNKPQQCKFSVPTNNHFLTEVGEIIPMSDKAWESVKGVPPCRN